MSTRDHLHDVLVREAERHEPPAFDLTRVVSGAGRRRRREQAVVGAGVTAVLVVAAGLVVAVLTAGIPRVDPGPAVHPTPTIHDQAGPLGSMPYCEPRLDGDRHDTLYANGRAFATLCAWHPQPEYGHHTYFWRHLGATVIDSVEGVRLVRGDDLIRIGTASTGVRISEDSRYVAWVDDQRQLTGFDVVRGRPLPHWPLPLGIDLATVEGITFDGQVFLSTPDGQVWTRNIVGNAPFAAVRGLPEGSLTPWGGRLSYVTWDGLAVHVRDATESNAQGRSVEGRVEADGRFVAEEEVPVGVASWSPDRNRYLELTPEGFRLHRTDNGTSLPLQTPGRLAPADQLWWDAQWDSPWTVLLSLMSSGENGAMDPRHTMTVRCSVRSGACADVSGVTLPLSVSAHPGVRPQ